ncbi:MAG: transposase [Candidatus Thiodiazotropha sp. (ex Monitilora ramsayi)]|nr:transposase [Candidatus Thiodiazotropha sp. (ex Monitilora ramsayi)]
MSNYRRAPVAGGTYFFTVMTFRRRPLFVAPLARRCLREAMVEVHRKRPFVMRGICLLPDHLHAIWTLPLEDEDFSMRWSRVKGLFSRYFLEGGGKGALINGSRIRRREVGIWQRRFWEHTIRNELDFKRHLDYIHFNPVKHGLVGRVADWPWSLFHRFVREGIYTMDWGGDAGLREDWRSVGE